MLSKSLLAAGAAAMALVLSAEAQTPNAYWISVLQDGVYRVAYEDLAAAGALGPTDSSRLALTNRGEAVRIWVNDGSDGSFDPGDSFEFVGSHLEGDTSFYSKHSRYNAYRLELDSPSSGDRMAAAGAAQRDDLPAAPLTKRDHLEDDQIMVRFAQRVGDPDTEVWFWKRMSFLDETPFEVTVETNGLAPGDARLRVQMRGWSKHRLPRNSGQRQHRASVAVNGIEVATGDWDRQDFLTIEGDIPAGALTGDEDRITVTVPSRAVANQADPMVDLSLLNWIEIDYPHAGVLRDGQSRLVVGDLGAREARLIAPSASSLVVFDDRGRRWFAGEESATDLTLKAHFEGGEALVFAVRDDAFLPPDGVAVDRASSWRSSDNRVDYLMIAHPTLIEGTERLAAYHRSRGLEVAVIDVQDVYDEFSHGIVHPKALRDFVANAYYNWAPPAPRFVLLVGDSSWDIDRGASDDASYADWSYQPREGTREGFLKNRSTPYSTGPDDRALIPTGSFKGAQGHAASDNYFVALDPDDFKPYLAIGRFPVVEPAELDAIVDKTIRYAEESGVGPWRRRLLWISNESEHIQRATDALAAQQEARGFASGKVYPLKSEKSNEQHQERLLEAFAEGQLVVYFHGHGGRYIWRTGPTDYKKNRDLFNLDHLDRLEPSARLPVVLSMTCFSAPFDHPLADSIGEKFLRLPDRGAVAVFAASWRNSPASAMSRVLVEELTKRQTIGEAILRAKQSTNRRDLVETYNLLGDPAVEVAAPQAALEVEVEAGESGELRLSAHLPDLQSGFEGRAVVDWLAADGTVVASEEVDVNGASMAAVLSTGPEARAVSVYMWDVERGLDGLGYFEWTSDDPEPEVDAVAGSASR